MKVDTHIYFVRTFEEIHPCDVNVDFIHYHYKNQIILKTPKKEEEQVVSV